MMPQVECNFPDLRFHHCGTRRRPSALAPACSIRRILRAHKAAGTFAPVEFFPKCDSSAVDPRTQVRGRSRLRESFPYVRTFTYPGRRRLQFLCSMTPIPIRTPAELVARIPKKRLPISRVDSAAHSRNLLRIPLSHEITLIPLFAALGLPALQDDRPINDTIYCALLATIVRRTSTRSASGFFLASLVPLPRCRSRPVHPRSDLLV